MPQTITSAGVTYTICPADDYAYTGPRCPMYADTKHAHFHQNLDDFREALKPAVFAMDDGSEWVDTSKVHPDLLNAYRGLLSYGYANGLLIPEEVA